MKIKVKRIGVSVEDGIITIFLPRPLEDWYYLCFTKNEWEELLKHNAAITDGVFTISRYFDELFIYRRKECIFAKKMNVTSFVQACLKITKEKDIKMDLGFFKDKNPVTSFPVYSWIEIGKWILQCQRGKETLKVLLRAIRNGKDIKNLKNILGAKVGKAYIYPDSYSENNLSFYFDGRFPGGCGWNGGIIFHSHSQTYSTHT